MSWAAGGAHFCLGLRQGQLEPASPGCTLLLFDAHGRLQGFSPLGFFLLRLYRLALEPTRHTLTLAEIVPVLDKLSAFLAGR